MRKFYGHVVKHRKSILIFFLFFAVLCGFLKNMVSVNYDMNDYLPEDVKSTVALNLMEQEFDGGIPNARVMIKEVKGVTEVTWLDDAVDITVPLDTLDQDTVEPYYTDRNCFIYGDYTGRKQDTGGQGYTRDYRR